MRLRQGSLQKVYLKKRIVKKDEEGNSITTFSNESIPLEMNVQSASGAVDATVYGEKLEYIEHAIYQGDEIKKNQNEKDGICLYVEADKGPDYQISSIKVFSTHVGIVLKRL